MHKNEIENTHSTINDLMKQAESMQFRLELDVQFKKNMEFIRKGAPDIYVKIKNFKPNSLFLQANDPRDINLINAKSKHPVYPGDAKEFAKKQVESHLLDPARFNIFFKETQLVNPRHLHPESANKALSSYASLGLPLHYTPRNPVGLLIILGCGLAYHIVEIVNTSDIRNLIIYDRVMDSFYHSLFLVDWESIVRKVNEKGGKVKLFIGEEEQIALRKMRSLSYEIGMHNMVTHRVFKHTESIDNDKFYNAFKIQFPMQISSLGFYDDEQVSFSHTLHNINSNFPLLNSYKEKTNYPVFVIGNGPSLDDLVTTIKENIENAVIISCGSAITTLYSLGIKPDIHVEVERNLGVAEMISFGTDIEYTKSIPLLAVNNVSPEVTKLFSNTFLAVKPNDLGASIINRIIEKSLYRELDLCNPTVTNCGLSYAVELGFKDIYLIGIDYGMPNKEAHHSKYSIWKKMDKKKEKNEALEKEAIEDYSYSNNQFEVKGNFIDKVITSTLLNTSKINSEVLIRENSNSRYYNPNNGAYIDGAKTIKKEDIKIKDKIDNKKAYIDNLLKSNFSDMKFKKMTDKNIKNEYISPLIKSKKALILPERCESIIELHAQLNRIFNNIEKIASVNEASPMLIRGTFQVHSGMLAYYCSSAKSTVDFNRYYETGKNIYNDLIENIFLRLSEEPLSLDDSLALK